MPMPRGKGGLVMIVLVLVGMYFGVDLSMLTGGGGGSPFGVQSDPRGATQPRPAAENELAEMVSVVLADTEDTWHTLFGREGQRYQEPKLVLFTGSTHTGCGQGQAVMGPFYCPADNKVYIDLSFYDQLHRQLGAPGDFAQAYVIAHEVGHHVQNLLGDSRRVQSQRGRVSQAEYNRLSVKLELQADCYAGVWAHHADRSRNLVERGDIDEAMRAAAAIGDDTLQRNAGRAVRKESFTHGSSAQRQRWFKRGMERGQPGDCDTFSARSL